jgi:hypothetical protein
MTHINSNAPTRQGEWNNMRAARTWKWWFAFSCLVSHSNQRTHIDTAQVRYGQPTDEVKVYNLIPSQTCKYAFCFLGLYGVVPNG